MTKTRKSRHRIPTSVSFVSDPIDERYQREVDRDTARLEQRYKAAQARAAAAETRAQRLAARAKADNASRLASAAWRAYEDALREVREIELLMQPSNTASARHRGRNSHTPAFK